MLFLVLCVDFYSVGDSQGCHFRQFYEAEIFFNRNFLLELALGSAGSLKLALPSPKQADSFLPHLEP